jgi:acylphosphatase
MNEKGKRMRKCLIIKIHGNVQSATQKSLIQKSAQSLSIEGTMQNYEDGVVIYSCGLVDRLDKFIDAIYKAIDKSKINHIETEPFVNEKDYRGVFRIIG